MVLVAHKGRNILLGGFTRSSPLGPSRDRQVRGNYAGVAEVSDLLAAFGVFNIYLDLQRCLAWGTVHSKRGRCQGVSGYFLISQCKCSGRTGHSFPAPTVTLYPSNLSRSCAWNQIL